VARRVYIPRIAGMDGDKFDFTSVCDVAQERAAGADLWYEGYLDSDDAPTTGWISSKLHPFESWRITLPTAREQWAKWYIDAGVDHFVECIPEDKEPVPGAEHHRHVVEIITKTYEAAETGKTQDLTTTF
jgi:predicted dehydrogenase